MSEPTFNGCVHLWLSSWMGWDQSKRQEDCPACPYCEIERLARELEEERELHLTARGQSDAYEMGMESWKGGYERLTREVEQLEACIHGLSEHAMKAAAEETRLRAALEQIADCPSIECARDPYLCKAWAREALEPKP